MRRKQLRLLTHLNSLGFPKHTQNNVIAVHRCHVGSLNSSLVHLRGMFKSAILNNAASVIVAHQHPSGNIFHRWKMLQED